MATNSQKKKILDLITSYYLESDNYNGYELNNLNGNLNLSWREFVNNVEELIIENKARLLFSDETLDCRIIRGGFGAKASQLQKLHEVGNFFASIYPSQEHLASVVDQSQFLERPYTLRLVLGDAQADFRGFDPKILDFYKNDNRFEILSVEGVGLINVENEFRTSKELYGAGRILSDFRPAFDENNMQVPAVYLRFLGEMGPEHQQLWKEYELIGNFKLATHLFNLP